jgi:hypothetical protein
MEFEESPLPARKSTYVHGIRGVDTHSFERRAMGDGRNDEPSIVFETDESTVKEVVNTRRQEQPVLAVRRWRSGRCPERRPPPLARNSRNGVTGSGTPLSSWLL